MQKNNMCGKTTCAEEQHVQKNNTHFMVSSSLVYAFIPAGFSAFPRCMNKWETETERQTGEEQTVMLRGNQKKGWRCSLE